MINLQSYIRKLFLLFNVDRTGVIKYERSLFNSLVASSLLAYSIIISPAKSVDLEKEENH